MRELIHSLAIVHALSFLVIFAFSYDQLSTPRRLTRLDDAVLEQLGHLIVNKFSIGI